MQAGHVDRGRRTDARHRDTGKIEFQRRFGARQFDVQAERLGRALCRRMGRPRRHARRRFGELCIDGGLLGGQFCCFSVGARARGSALFALLCRAGFGSRLGLSGLLGSQQGCRSALGGPLGRALVLRRTHLGRLFCCGLFGGKALALRTLGQFHAFCIQPLIFGPLSRSRALQRTLHSKTFTLGSFLRRQRIGAQCHLALDFGALGKRALRRQVLPLGLLGCNAARGGLLGFKRFAFSLRARDLGLPRDLHCCLRCGLFCCLLSSQPLSFFARFTRHPLGRFARFTRESLSLRGALKLGLAQRLGLGRSSPFNSGLLGSGMFGGQALALGQLGRRTQRREAFGSRAFSHLPRSFKTSLFGLLLGRPLLGLALGLGPLGGDALCQQALGGLEFGRQPFALSAVRCGLFGSQPLTLGQLGRRALSGQPLGLSPIRRSLLGLQPFLFGPFGGQAISGLTFGALGTRSFGCGQLRSQLHSKFLGLARRLGLVCSQLCRFLFRNLFRHPLRQTGQLGLLSHGPFSSNTLSFGALCSRLFSGQTFAFGTFGGGLLCGQTRGFGALSRSPLRCHSSSDGTLRCGPFGGDAGRLCQFSGNLFGSQTLALCQCSSGLFRSPALDLGGGLACCNLFGQFGGPPNDLFTLGGLQGGQCRRTPRCLGSSRRFALGHQTRALGLGCRSLVGRRAFNRRTRLRSGFGAGAGLLDRCRFGCCLALGGQPRGLVLGGQLLGGLRLDPGGRLRTGLGLSSLGSSARLGNLARSLGVQRPLGCFLSFLGLLGLLCFL